MLTYTLLAAAALFSRVSVGQVVGSATGFATGVTGGGNVDPVTPADIDELVSYLTDSEPRVILIDKEFNFIGSEGTTTDTGCRPSSNTCPNNGGQDAINGANWCSSSYPAVSVTYDNAAMEGINVASDKSIVGVGSAGVIKGKGLRLVNGVSNIIIQNIHITDLNPQYIWGGDAITLAGCDKVWIDHVKFSLIGRQMLVTGYDAAGKVTISNSEFDGTTDWSASCNNDHYWTMLFYGASDQITLQNNYIHDVSGRAPKVGGSGSTTMHSVNNFFSNNGGHDFDVGKGGSVLIEGCVFDKVDTPITTDSASAGGSIFNVPDSSAASTCTSYIGRSCVTNSVTDSGEFASYTDTTILSSLSSYDNIVEAMDVSKVQSYVVANAGIGKLSSSSSSSSSGSSSSSKPSVAVSSSSSAAIYSPTPVVNVISAPSSTPKKTCTRNSSTLSTAVRPTTSTAASAPVQTGSSGTGSSGAIKKYSQCGGQSWAGSGSCEAGTTCKEWSTYYHQCVEA